MLILSAITALLIHESGHLWVALALGQPAKGLVLRWWGFGVRIGRSPKPWVNAVIAAGGPVASALAFLFFCWAGMNGAALANCCVLVFGSVLDIWHGGNYVFTRSVSQE